MVRSGMGALCKIAMGVGLAAVLGARATPPAGYWLAWSDECSSNDASKFANWLTGWRRDAYNTGSAVSHSNGIRSIITYTAGGTNFTGMISTSGKFQERYGFWEAYIDYNGMTGMWSAFWVQSPTMGSYIGDPARAGSEIDICEHRSYNSGGSFIGSDYAINNHWDGYGADHKSVGTTVGGVGANTGFHTYGFLWDEVEYQFYYDNALRWTTTNGHSRRPEFAILSSEVENASWAGNIPPAGYGTTNNPLAKMQIDWVRWYAPSNYTIWDGSSTNGSWGDTNNWTGGRTPNAGRVVVFDGFTQAGYTNFLNTSRSIDGLVVTEPGNAIVIASNILTLGGAGIDMEMNSHSLVLNCGLTLGAAQTWNVGSLGLTVNGDIGGAFGLTKLGAGSLTLAGSNTYTQTTTIREGTLYPADGWALGATNAGTIIATGARLFGLVNLASPEPLALAGSGPDGTGAMRIGSGADVVWKGSVRLTNDAMIKLDGGTTLAFQDTLSISNFVLTLAGDGGSTGTLRAAVTGAGWVVKSGGGIWSIETNQPAAATHWFADGGTLQVATCSVTSTTWCGAGSVSNAAGTLVLNSGAQFACAGDFNVADVDGSRGTLRISAGATLLPNTLYVGKWGNATGTVSQDGGVVSNFDATPGEWRIGGYSTTNDADAFGRYNLNAGAFFTAGNLHVGAYGRGEWLQAGGTGLVAGWVSTARFPGGSGLFSVSNGVFVQSDATKRFIVGEQGTGTLAIALSGLVIASGGVHIAFGPASRGTVQLNGGVLATPFLQSTGGVSALNFNGGTLRATASSANFIQTIDAATIQGVAIFDTAGFSNTVSQVLAGTGRLVKTGAGLLSLTASNLFSGGTIVSGGVLRSAAPFALGTGAVTVAANGMLEGTGVVRGPVTVQAGGVLSPGTGLGTLSVGDVATLLPGSTSRLEITRGGSVHDALLCTGALTLGGTLSVTNVGPALVAGDAFTVMVATAVSGAFSATNLPALSPSLGWSVQYQPGAVVLAVVGGYDLYATQIANVALRGVASDADGDGFANLLEYVTGGNPTAADATARLVATTATNGLLAVRFSRATNATDATLYVQGAAAATNDAAWLSIAVNSNGLWSGLATVTETGASPAVVTVQDIAPGATNRFLRLRVTRP